MLANRTGICDANSETGQVSGLVPAATTDARRLDALSKLETALSRANKARDAEHTGKIADAFYWWDMVFDGHFPAYG